MQTPSIGRIVIYTDNAGTRHAAIIARDPGTDDTQIELVAFAFAGCAAYPIYACQGDERGQWQWPVYVKPPQPAPPYVPPVQGVGAP